MIYGSANSAVGTLAEANEACRAVVAHAVLSVLEAAHGPVGQILIHRVNGTRGGVYVHSAVVRIRVHAHAVVIAIGFGSRSCADAASSGGGADRAHLICGGGLAVGVEVCGCIIVHGELLQSGIDCLRGGVARNLLAADGRYALEAGKSANSVGALSFEAAG